jgi:protein-S-isoprenylcysteine O-methyltransferase Ste14
MGQSSIKGATHTTHFVKWNKPSTPKVHIIGQKIMVVLLVHVISMFTQVEMELDMVAISYWLGTLLLHPIFILSLLTLFLFFCMIIMFKIWLCNNIQNISTN